MANSCIVTACYILAIVRGQLSEFVTEPQTGTVQPMAPGAATVKTPSLRYWRVRRALLQGQLATRAGVDSSSVWRGENGQPLRLDTVAKLAEVLQVEPAQLMSPPTAD